MNESDIEERRETATVKHRRRPMVILGIVALIIGLFFALPYAALIALSPNKTAACVEQTGAPGGIGQGYVRSGFSAFPLGERCDYRISATGEVVSVAPPWDATIYVYGGILIAAAGAVLLVTGAKRR